MFLLGNSHFSLKPQTHFLLLHMTALNWIMWILSVFFSCPSPLFLFSPLLKETNGDNVCKNIGKWGRMSLSSTICSRCWLFQEGQHFVKGILLLLLFVNCFFPPLWVVIVHLLNAVQVYEMRNAGAVIHSHGMESCLVTMINSFSKEFRVIFGTLLLVRLKNSILVFPCLSMANSCFYCHFLFPSIHVH